MRFRPCIDIHDGKVKQIVGGSLIEKNDQVKENYISELDAAYYADFYKKDGLKGGHIILLNSASSSYYEESKGQAFAALKAYPGGLQIGGGITADNALDYLRKEASHVIITSYVFQNGQINYEHLEKVRKRTGKEHLVLDLSCRRKGEDYVIVTDRWQKFTETAITEETLDILAKYCDEFLVHGVDVEGKSSGIEKDLVKLLGGWEGIPITYAGGIGSFADLDDVKISGKNKLDVTIGSALDLFGGTMSYREVLRYMEV